MMSLDCTESYSVSRNDEAPALRDPNDKSFFCQNGGIVRVKGLFRYVGEHYVNSSTESKCYGSLFIPGNLFFSKNLPIALWSAVRR